MLERNKAFHLDHHTVPWFMKSHHPKQNKSKDLTNGFLKVFTGLTSFHIYFYEAVGYYASHVLNKKTISKVKITTGLNFPKKKTKKPVFLSLKKIFCKILNLI